MPAAFPLPEQAAEAQAKRRIGLGVTGLADALLMVGLRYGSDEAARVDRSTGCTPSRGRPIWPRSIWPTKRAPSRCSTPRAILASGNMAQMDADVREAIAQHGIRNALLTSVAPTGTISPLRRQRQFGDRAGLRLCLHPQGPAEGRLAAPRKRSSTTPSACGAKSMATRPCPTISSTPRPCRRWTMSGCRRRRRNGSIRRSPRPSTARWTSALTISRRSTWPPGIRAAKAARPTGRTT